MKWIMCLVMAVLFLHLMINDALAESPAVVLRGLSAVPTEGSEWIALENTSSATISGQIWSIRDVQGSIKTWILPGLQPYELKMFSSTETKISLNNTGDQVELLQGSVVVQSSSPYEELSAGSLWVLLSEGWQEIEESEWERRWPVRDWQAETVVVSPTPMSTISPAASLAPGVSPQPIQSAVPHISPSPVVKSEEQSWWEKVSLPTVAQVSTHSAISDLTPPIWERPPGDFDNEWHIFQNWKRDIWYRLGVTFFASLLSLVLCAPKLYRCYNELCLLDDG